MKKIKFLAVLLACVTALFCVSSCGGDSADTIKIGLIAPKTGGVAVYGNAVVAGAELYIEQLNAAGGINGKKVKLIEYDDKGDATEALNAYNKLVSSDGVCAILGPVTSSPTFGVAQASAAENVPCITATATHPDVTTYGSNYFRVCFEDPFQGGAIARYAANGLGAKTGAIIYNTADSYSTGLRDSITAEAQSLGMTITNAEGYAAGDTDFNAQLTNILKSAPDVLFIPNYYNDAYMICSQARALGYGGIFLGVDGTDGVLEIEGADTSVFNGMYFANHYAADDPSESVQSFIKDYTAKYGTAPNSFSALAYDAAGILCDAIKTVDSSDITLGATAESYAAVIDALRATDRDCVTGHITFDEDGNPIKDCKIIGIKDGAYYFVDKY
ncbi:MAG: ABC transporter substrate-binding protein [Eubacteriales bacterium]